MTPDLQTRIEKLAREAIADETICSCQSCQISAVHAVKNALTTLAEQIIAEKDAEAAEMREAIEDCIDTVGIEHLPWVDANDEEHDCPEDDTCSCAHIIALNTALSSTAGRDTLAELASLRERVKELEGRVERYENSGRV